MASALVRARGQIAFVIGLAVASAIVLAIERRQFVPASDIPAVSGLIRPVAADVRTQWEYVERNYQAMSGLVNDEDGQEATSVAGAGDALKAMLAAHRLGLIDGRELYRRVSALLKTVATVSPEQAHRRLSTRTGEPIEGESDGSVAPLVSALELVAWSYPANSAQAAAELRRWADLPPSGGRSVDSALHRAAQTLAQAAMMAEGDRR